jgi:hypothetical protein
MKHRSGAMKHRSGAMKHRSGAMKHRSGAMKHRSGAVPVEHLERRQRFANEVYQDTRLS